MSARVTWQGLEALRADLRRLPADLTDEAGGIVLGAAEDAKRGMVAQYQSHWRGGTLADHVVVAKASRGRFGAAATIKNTSPHAVFLERGTQARHTATGSNRGVMPASPIFNPNFWRARRRMFDQLKDLLVRHGLTVTGDA